MKDYLQLLISGILRMSNLFLSLMRELVLKMMLKETFILKMDRTRKFSLCPNKIQNSTMEL